ncbi:hypothetical protein VIAG107301_14580 [Vibrio agarivorans]
MRLVSVTYFDGTVLWRGGRFSSANQMSTQYEVYWNMRGYTQNLIHIIR